MTTTKVSTRTTRSGDTECIHGLVAMYTKVTTKEICVTDTERCCGPMEDIIKAIGSMASNMAKVDFIYMIGEMYVPNEGYKKGRFDNNVIVEVWQ